MQLTIQPDGVILVTDEPPGRQAQLDRIESLLNKETLEMSQMDDSITALTAQVTANTTVTGSAVTMINGFSAQLAAAIAAAQAAGATPAQLKSLNDLNTAVKASDDDLAAAIAANTPAG